MAAKTQNSLAVIRVNDVKCILLFHWLYDSLQPMRLLAAADWLPCLQRSVSDHHSFGLNISYSRMSI